MTSTTSLMDQVQQLVCDARGTYAGTPGSRLVEEVAHRIDEPLRVAIAGKVKAGKSTLLNALIGQEFAPTDAGECTRIVTWFCDGTTYRLEVCPRHGQRYELPFIRRNGRVRIDLGSLEPEEVERMVVTWPSATLRAMTLIDTPGMNSANTEVSERTHALLAPEDERSRPADAVLYLMRHLHQTDVRFLEAFHDDEQARAQPVNAIGILSRADEVGSGRLDAMESARRIAARYRCDPKVRRLCQTVVPIAGLLAQSASTLREVEYRAFRLIADAEQSESEALLLSADRFGHMETAIELLPEERIDLLHRFGLFGLRLGVAAIHGGGAETASALSRALLAHSGLEELRTHLVVHLGARADVLKARSALCALEQVVRHHPTSDTPRLLGDVERIRTGAHEFAEFRLFDALRSGMLSLAPEDEAQAERLIGAAGNDVLSRVGASADADRAQIRDLTLQALGHWQRRAESPLSSRDLVFAARVIVRTCEGILGRLGLGDGVVA